MSDLAHLDPSHPESGAPAPQTELPPWLRKALIGLGLAGPFVGWFIGFLTTPEDANPVDLVREVLKAATGPFGATILAVLALGALSWHHVRTLTKHELERKDRAGSTARVADKLETRIKEKDEKLEEASDKTLSVFKGTVSRYEKVLSEVNARTDVQAQQLIEMRTDLKAIKAELARLT